MNNIPKISIVVPCYNMSRYVAETIHSVFDQMSADWELIVVDDGSSDDSLCVIMDTIFQRLQYYCRAVTLVTRNNGGLAAARNSGIECARGEWILPLDADDILVPTAVAEYVAAVQANPSADVIMAWFHHFGNGEDKIVKREWLGYRRLLQGNTIPSECLFRKAAWERVGGYRDGTMYEDWDFWLRLLDKPQPHVVTIPQTLTHYRQRPDSMNHIARTRNAEEHRIIREMNKDIYNKYGL